MTTVLFVCVQNSCRSQMAEGFARALGKGIVEPYSAGSKPSGGVDPTAIEVMRERGIDISGQGSKGFTDLPVKQVDYLVTMGCQDVCPIFPAIGRIDWKLDDPAGKPIEGFRRVRDEIGIKVAELIGAIRTGERPVQGFEIKLWAEANVDGFFKGKGLEIGGLVHLSGQEALEAARGGALFVDLRLDIETDYKKYDVPEVLYIQAEELETRISEIPRDRPVVVADSVGLRSKEAVKWLMGRGYGNVANLNGGILDWEHDGLPLIVDLDKQLSGSCTCRLRPKT